MKFLQKETAVNHFPAVASHLNKAYAALHGAKRIQPARLATLQDLCPFDLWLGLANTIRSYFVFARLLWMALEANRNSILTGIEP